jgi:hypothetical protein
MLCAEILRLQSERVRRSRVLLPGLVRHNNAKHEFAQSERERKANLRSVHKDVQGLDQSRTARSHFKSRPISFLLFRSFSFSSFFYIYQSKNQDCYNSIKKEQFKFPLDDGTDLMLPFFDPIREGWLWKQGGRYKTWKRRWFILNDGCLYYFEFTEVNLTFSYLFPKSTLFLLSVCLLFF